MCSVPFLCLQPSAQFFHHLSFPDAEITGDDVLTGLTYKP